MARHYSPEEIQNLKGMLAQLAEEKETAIRLSNEAWRATSWATFAPVAAISLSIAVASGCTWYICENRSRGGCTPDTRATLGIITALAGFVFFVSLLLAANVQF